MAAAALRHAARDDDLHARLLGEDAHRAGDPARAHGSWKWLRWPVRPGRAAMEARTVVAIRWRRVASMMIPAKATPVRGLCLLDDGSGDFLFAGAKLFCDADGFA
jgi:hypothetical protein